ncbi:MAG: hypothetical protein M1839_001332 [Geoglossum umbratile]|nr:MAG: hypothetical protein M1839_001332 [Geoglossum umbratile]
MQQVSRPRMLRQPTASKLARPVSFNLDAQAQDAGVAAVEDRLDQKFAPRPLGDASSSSSRLPAPTAPRPQGDGGNIGGLKRRSMLPQLSPTKGYRTALEAGKHEHRRINEENNKSDSRGDSTTPSAGNTMDNTKNPPLLGIPVYQSRETDATPSNAFGETRIKFDLKDAPLKQDTGVRQSDGPINALPTEPVSSRPRTLPQPRILPAAAGLGSRPAPSESKGAGVITKSAVPGRAWPPRQLTTHAATTSANTSRDITNKTGFSTVTTGAAPARPRSMILNAGRDFCPEIQPTPPASASSAELAQSDKPDAKRQPPGHRRTPSTRSERSAFSGKPKELERKDAIASSGKALAFSREANATVEQKRPAFSTLQQHFTPKKAPKAPTSFNLTTGPGKQPNGELISPETARLQTELLQLHFLHKSSAGVLHAWRQSAEDKLRGRFEEVAQKHRKVAVLERRTQAQLNLRALKEFAHEGRNGQGLGEQIQALGSVIPEIVNVTGAGGKYARLVKGFERWIEWIERIWEARDHGGKAFNSRGELEFVEGLGDGWRDETAGMSRKLEHWLRDLDGIGSTPTGSSFALVVARCRCLTEGMLQELDIMRGMERAIVARESYWVSEKVAELSTEIDGGFGKTGSTLTTDKERGPGASKQGIWMIP